MLDKKHPLITLLTDFGTKDAFVGAMKGVILSICPEAKIVDISHEVPKFDIRYGAFLLAQVAPYYTKGTIHMVVIDPGVGTIRRRIIVQGERGLYVGPDNGVFSLVTEQERVIKVFEIKNQRFMRLDVSNTFEGRDVFAPTSAYLAKGIKPEDFGPEVQDLVKLLAPKIRTSERTIIGEIVYIDSFGNLITNIEKGKLIEVKIVEGSSLIISINNVSKKMTFCRVYEEVPIGISLAIIGSSGLLEVSVNHGSAEALFRAQVGDRINVSLVTRKKN